MKTVVALALAMVLIAAPFVSAKENYDARIARAEQELSPVKEKIRSLEARIRIADDTYARLEGVYGKALSRIGQARSQAGKVRGEIRKLDIKLARMRQVGPLAEAWNKYKQNPTEAQFVELWTYVKGTPPDNGTRSQYTVMESVLHKEILNKGVTGVALALVQIGKLTMTLVDVLSGEAFKEPAGQVADFLKEYVVDKALEATGAADIFGASTVVKTVAGLSDASGALGELEDQAQAMADEAYEKAQRALNGLGKGQDLTTEIKKAEAARAVAEALLEKKELALEPVQKAVDIPKKNLAHAREQIDAWKVEKEALVAKQRALEEKMDDYKLLAVQQGALASLDAQRDDSQVGDPYATNLSLRINGNNLATDELAARLTGYPRTLRVQAATAMAVVKKAPLTYEVKLSKDKTVTKTATRLECRSLGQVFNLPDVTLTGFPGVKIDNRLLKIEGRSPGTGKVTAQIDGGQGRMEKRKLGETEFADCRKVSKKYVSDPVDIGVWQAASMTLSGLSPTEEKTGTLDFFVDTGRTVATVPRVTVSNGSDSRTYNGVPGQLLHVRTSDNHFPVTIEGERAVRIQAPKTPGKANLTIRVGVAGNDDAWFEKQLRLKASRMEATVLPVGVSMGEGRVPLDEPVTCRVIVTGEVDMKPYQVQWSGFDDQVDYLETTGFKWFEDRWISDNVIVFRSAGLDLGTTLGEAKSRLGKMGLYSVARVIHGESKQPVGRPMELPGITPVPPKLERVRIVPGTGAATGVSRLDFFRPDNRSGRNLRIAVQGIFAGGIKLWIPVDYMESEWQGDLAAAGIGFDPREGLEIHSDAARFGEVGSAVLTVGLDQHTANRKGLFLASSELHARMTFTNNCIQVVQGGTEAAPLIQTKVYGPADIGNCKAQWRFLGNMQETTGFARKANLWFSEIPATGGHIARRLLSVDLVSPGGEVLASYRCGDMGKPLPPVVMRIQLPENAQPGEKAILTAVVENISEYSADEYTCRWRVDPKFGELMKTDTAVFVAGGNQARSRNTLFLNEDFSGDVSVPVEAELFLKIGVANTP
ncbi:MAG: hypothetical protein JEZ11_25970 [Desulfobacterales bacterium]|nr:hypothetical protein [Desulfobacterales bacterium]